MNMSEVINDIKLLNGLNTIALPFKQPVEVVIREALQISIRTFSRFKPIQKEGIVSRKQLRSPSQLDAARGVYILPPELTTSPVQDAYAYLADYNGERHEQMTTSFSIGSPFVGFGSYGPQDMMNATHTGAAVNKYAGITTRTPTSKWLGSNKIQLFDFPEDAWLHIIAKTNHDENGETIEESCVESFMELANLDVQTVMYNNLKNMNNTGGAFKEIQLKIDEWAGSAAARKELVASWTNTFHYDDLDLIQFF